MVTLLMQMEPVMPLGWNLSVTLNWAYPHMQFAA